MLDAKVSLHSHFEMMMMVVTVSKFWFSGGFCTISLQYVISEEQQLAAIIFNSLSPDQFVEAAAS